MQWKYEESVVLGSNFKIMIKRSEFKGRGNMVTFHFGSLFHNTCIRIKTNRCDTDNADFSQTEVTSTPTRPVDNVIAMKGLQDRNNNCLMEGWWKIEVN